MREIIGVLQSIADVLETIADNLTPVSNANSDATAEPEVENVVETKSTRTVKKEVSK